MLETLVGYLPIALVGMVGIFVALTPLRLMVNGLTPVLGKAKVPLFAHPAG